MHRHQMSPQDFTLKRTFSISSVVHIKLIICHLKRKFLDTYMHSTWAVLAHAYTHVQGSLIGRCMLLSLPPMCIQLIYIPSFCFLY